ncbi:MAG: hypothetical protein ACXACA_07945 [Candidatus Ranarchaeia archaeon]|jgi:predicted membrane protein
MKRPVAVCIVALVCITAIAVGGVTYFNNAQWPGVFDDTTVYYHFDRTISGPESATVSIQVSAGTVNLEFTDNASLLYHFDVGVLNQTVQQNGAPTVDYNNATKRITLSYVAGTVNVTLGTGVNYTISCNVVAGTVNAQLASSGTVNNVTLQTTTGSIILVMTSSFNIDGRAIFDLDATTGSISVNLALPAGVEGSFEGAASVGNVDITAPSWVEITSEHYETSGFDTATNRVAIYAETTTGSVDANLL